MQTIVNKGYSKLFWQLLFKCWTVPCLRVSWTIHSSRADFQAQILCFLFYSIKLVEQPFMVPSSSAANFTPIWFVKNIAFSHFNWNFEAVRLEICNLVNTPKIGSLHQLFVVFKKVVDSSGKPIHVCLQMRSMTVSDQLEVFAVKILKMCAITPLWLTTKIAAWFENIRLSLISGNKTELFG